MARDPLQQYSLLSQIGARQAAQQQEQQQFMINLILKQQADEREQARYEEEQKYKNLQADKLRLELDPKRVKLNDAALAGDTAYKTAQTNTANDALNQEQGYRETMQTQAETGQVLEDFNTGPMEAEVGGVVPFDKPSAATRARQLMDAFDKNRQAKIALSGKYSKETGRELGNEGFQRFTGMGEKPADPTKNFEREKDLSSLYDTRIGDDGVPVLVAKLPANEMPVNPDTGKSYPAVVVGDQIEALKKRFESDRTRKTLEEYQSAFTQAQKEKTPYPEEDFIVLQSLAPRSQQPQLRREWLANQAETGVATDEQEKELKKLVDKDMLDMGETYSAKVANGDGTETVTTYKKLDYLQQGTKAKPISVVRGSPKEIENSVAANIQTQYFASIKMVKNVKLADQYVEPEFLEWYPKGINAYNKMLEKSGLASDIKKEKIYNFERWSKGVQRALNAYRLIITGQASGLPELERIEASFMSGKMSFSEYRAAVDSIMEEAQSFQETYKETSGGRKMPSPPSTERSSKKLPPRKPGETLGDYLKRTK